MDARIYERKINTLVTFDEVLRDPNIFLLHLILDVPKVRKQFTGYFDIERFSCQSEERIRTIMLNRDKKNFLEWGALKEFDYESNYNKMYHQFPGMYEESPPLDMFRAVSRMINEPFVKNMFIWNPVEDRRQEYDIVQTLGKNPKIQYVTGPYLDVVDAIGDIQVFIDNDIERLFPVIQNGRYFRSNFFIARYGYNYTLSKTGIPILKEDCTNFAFKYSISLSEFLPFNISPEGISNG